MKRPLTLRAFAAPPSPASERVAGVKVFAFLPMLALAACADQVATAVAPGAPGFLWGLWHGFIFPVAWIVSLFDSGAAVYAVPNNGGWYDFGYFIGIVFLGVGARKTRVIYRDRAIDVRARRVEELEP